MTLKIDPYSTTWLNIRSHIEQRLVDIRAKLEADTPWDETCQLRARLKELKTILSATEVELPIIDQDFELPG